MVSFNTSTVKRHFENRSNNSKVRTTNTSEMCFQRDLTIQSMQVEICSEKDVIFTCTKRAFDENVSLASLGVILSSAEMFWEPFRNGLGVI